MSHSNLLSLHELSFCCCILMHRLHFIFLSPHNTFSPKIHFHFFFFLVPQSGKNDSGSFCFAGKNKTGCWGREKNFVLLLHSEFTRSCVTCFPSIYFFCNTNFSNGAFLLLLLLCWQFQRADKLSFCFLAKEI